MALAELTGPYKVQEYDVRSRGITTNKCPSLPTVVSPGRCRCWPWRG